MSTLKVVTLMSRLPATLTNMDFFKILEEEPQEIVINEVNIKPVNDGWSDTSYLELQLELVATKQTCNHRWTVSHGDSSREYYIDMRHELHPLLSYECGIENNALTYWDEELEELLTGLRFKTTGKTELINDRRIFTIIPITEEAV